MPVQSMSCPKCGRQATEYAEGKWQCLHCGIKFLYEKPTAPITNIATTVSLDAAALYDIEAGGPANNKPLMKTSGSVYGCDESFMLIRRKWAAADDIASFAGKATVFVIPFLILGMCAKSSLLTTGGLLLLVASIALYVALRVRSRRLRDEMYNRERELALIPGPQKQVGTIVLCPYCRADYKSYPHDEQSPRQLTHCLKCGKQFLIDGLNSYRIRLK
jgi:DNA-directed RNA polymerase subunit RPC12/RpoP